VSLNGTKVSLRSHCNSNIKANHFHQKGKQDKLQPGNAVGVGISFSGSSSSTVTNMF
jgi:hypothetical protein